MKPRTTLAILLALLSIATIIGPGCGGPRPLSKMTARELFEEGSKKFQKRKYLRAIEIFQACVYNFPGDEIVDSAQYYLALSYFENDEHEVAQVEFNRLVLNYPSSVYLEQSVFMRAACFFEATPRHHGLDQSELETAIRQFEDFIIDFPESESVNDARAYLLVARSRLARKYYDAGIVYSRIAAYQAAQIYFQKVIDDFTDTEYAPLATYEFAVMDLKQDKFTEAQSGFKDFQTVFADHEKAERAHQHEIEAAFKPGQAAFKKGEFTTAREKLEAFKVAYPNHKLTGKADKYLRKIAERMAAGPKVDGDES
ncbi:MAG: outer membrane protein assembly factor BamD [candidate division Zixibacteria bacterium]|nr:outer membrane protein assembly factor BamD [candidate division Zixibacteria bacterium]MDH3935819.1 outer membrane protein assembly factor BamD [candidate division Zixibacteria bacterium]MDH4032843.1 outer membrane protein assembly factor BamD [candidate division Zixibacteria bacterium]